MLMVVYGCFLVGYEYQHPRPLDTQSFMSRARFLKRLVGFLVVFTLGPWLLFKWHDMQTEVPWLALLWAASAVVYLLRPNPKHT